MQPMECTETKRVHSKGRFENSAPNESVTSKPLLNTPSCLHGISSNLGVKKSEKSKSAGYKSHESVVFSFSNLKKRNQDAAATALCENQLQA